MKRYYTGDDLEALGNPNLDDVEALVKELAKRLQGKHPFVQSAALADVVAMYFAGHNPVYSRWSYRSVA
jgi:hypothetical protein